MLETSLWYWLVFCFRNSVSLTCLATVVNWLISSSSATLLKTLQVRGGGKLAAKNVMVKNGCLLFLASLLH